MKKAKELVAEMTLEEKAALCSGLNFWHTKGVERLGLEPVLMTDGPHGLRKQGTKADHLGLNQSVPATCFPAACAIACSFDPELAYEMGRAMGEECLQEGVAVILGPGLNIKRSPLCGRNFEYFSEDPLLSGELAAALVQGIQSKGVGTSVKHFAANNQEKARLVSNSIIDERALREIYLAGFETVVKKAKPWTVMCSYNRINGVYACENPLLLTELLRREWDFDGLVVTDWGAMDDRVSAARAGLDLEMPGPCGRNDRALADAVLDGTLPQEALDRCAENVTTLLLKHAEHSAEGYRYNAKNHDALAQRLAANSAVLLKNEGGLLPVTGEMRIAVIGAFAKAPRYQGAGSSKINPTQISCAWDAIQSRCGRAVYAAGYNGPAVNDALIREACEAAKGKDAVLVFAGLPDECESEGFDRTTLAMPESHNALIAALAEVNPHVAVVLQCGSAVTMPWRDRVSSILLTYLGGQAGGRACADLLFGEANPSGKLAETFPLSLEDTPSYLHFSSEEKDVQYRESIFVGYRWYDSTDRRVLYPFGYGLSYTKFELSGVRLSSARYEAKGVLRVEVTVENTGSCAGAEVVQVYVSKPASDRIRCARELRAFQKVSLELGEKKDLALELGERAFACYDPEQRSWIVEGGTYHILVGTSSRDLPFRETVTVESETENASAQRDELVLRPYFTLPHDGVSDIPETAFTALFDGPLPVTKSPTDGRINMNTTLGELKGTEAGAMLMEKASPMFAGMADDIQVMFNAMLSDMPLRALCMLSGGAWSMDAAQAFVADYNAALG